ncbi:hypothetical protein QBC39DRAFT_375763 [Podospora conica]|nr:hypothetical protein QBC39DRAFT_375763 [Schizothecium conicum]
MTVLESGIDGPVQVQKRPKDEAIAEAREPPETWEQRVGIARVLVLKANGVLFDEPKPTSAPDPELVGEVLGVTGDASTGLLSEPGGPAAPEALPRSSTRRTDALDSPVVDKVKITELLVTKELRRVLQRHGRDLPHPGCPDMMIGQTLANPDNPIGTKTSPLAGREKAPRRHQRSRLLRVFTSAQPPRSSSWSSDTDLMSFADNRADVQVCYVVPGTNRRIGDDERGLLQRLAGSMLPEIAADTFAVG